MRPAVSLDVAVGGITLHLEEAGAGFPVLLLHGFTGSAATWQPLVAALGAGYRALAVDLVGHGHSSAPVDPALYTMERCVDDLRGLLDARDVPRVAVLGYSMGGRVALHLAAAAPDRVAALVLESASPGLAGAAERAARVQADEELAGSIERDGVAAFVDRWQRLPLFATQEALPEEVRTALRRQRLANSALGLANSLRSMGTGRQVPLWERLPALAMPALVIAGAEDARYAEIAARMAALLPTVRLAVVHGAGHAVHLEQPAAFAALVGSFLAGLPP